MLTRKRRIWLATLSVATLLAAAPCKIAFDGLSAAPAAPAAFAKGGGGGEGGEGGGQGGGGKGDDGNAGGGGNPGNGGGNPGKGGMGNAGGNAGGLGRGRGQKGDLATGRIRIEVRHRNGIRERLGNGRYEMKDAQGRVIINRRATGSDYMRLRSMSN